MKPDLDPATLEIGETFEQDGATWLKVAQDTYALVLDVDKPEHSNCTKH